ncbi:MAG: glycogen synthase GlgA [Lachnospiraceae bacterium]|nr:glycogen synthase GlgA [Lachnospiraceae bacterium]
MKNILLAASECVPFIKTGGLADVAGAMPKYFDKRKYDVRVIMPNYGAIPQKYRDQMEYVTHFYTGWNFQDRYVGLLKLVMDGVTYYFIDCNDFFSGDKPYGYIEGDIEKFSFFSRQVLSVLPHLDWKPDVIHCNDWQTALIPVYLNDSFQGDVFYHQIKTIFAIHNLKFQGIWSLKDMPRLTNLSEYYFTPDKMEAYGDGNMLKGGLLYADRIVTVSETYAEEIKTPFYGEKLDGVLRARANVLSGIVNGIDTAFYNPKTDADIAYHYDVRTALAGKAENKKALQKELGLKEDPNAFMIGICSRLTDQKGLDLIEYVMDDICREDVQFVILGTGDPKYEALFRTYAERYPDRVSANFFYSESLSHRIYAACDAYLMPSLFEPCGLSQLMALRYGTLPIVRETGGLKDTVQPYNEYTNEGTGFSFANINAHEMLSCINYAKSVYYEHRDAWNEMIVRAMNQDFSWKASAKKYGKLYDELIEEKRNTEKRYKKEGRKA